MLCQGSAKTVKECAGVLAQHWQYVTLAIHQVKKSKIVLLMKPKESVSVFLVMLHQLHSLPPATHTHTHMPHSDDIWKVSFCACEAQLSLRGQYKEIDSFIPAHCVLSPGVIIVRTQARDPVTRRNNSYLSFEGLLLSPGVPWAVNNTVFNFQM